MDDVTYTALDEATKASEVDVVYARSMYAGAANASTKLAGEVIGIIAGPSPAEVRSGLAAALSFMENGGHFTSANEDDSIVYYAQTISRTGTYLSKQAGIAEGEPLAYLIAPPLEAIYGLDAALKAADVQLVQFYAPPSETNFAGGLLTGHPISGAGCLRRFCSGCADDRRQSPGAVGHDRCSGNDRSHRLDPGSGCCGQRCQSR